MSDNTYKYLKDYVHCSELYDRISIDECECWENSRGTVVENSKTKEEIEQKMKFFATR